MIQHDHPLTPPTNPGASSSAVVYDSGALSLADIANARHRKYKRLRVSIYTDVADMKLRCEWAAPGSSNLRTFQTDLTISANTYTQRNIRLQPGRTKISLITTTAPTMFEVGADLVEDQALDQ